MQTQNSGLKVMMLELFMVIITTTCCIYEFDSRQQDYQQLLINYCLSDTDAGTGTYVNNMKVINY